MYQYNGLIPDGEHITAGQAYPAAHFIRYSLPKSLGRQVVLCTNQGNYRGQLKSIDQDTAVLHHVGGHWTINIASINAIVSQASLL